MDKTCSLLSRWHDGSFSKLETEVQEQYDLYLHQGMHFTFLSLLAYPFCRRHWNCKRDWFLLAFKHRQKDHIYTAQHRYIWCMYMLAAAWEIVDSVNTEIFQYYFFGRSVSGHHSPKLTKNIYKASSFKPSTHLHEFYMYISITGHLKGWGYPKCPRMHKRCLYPSFNVKVKS